MPPKSTADQIRDLAVPPGAAGGGGGVPVIPVDAALSQPTETQPGTMRRTYSGRELIVPFTIGAGSAIVVNQTTSTVKNIKEMAIGESVRIVEFLGTSAQSGGTASMKVSVDEFQIPLYGGGSEPFSKFLKALFQAAGVYE